MSIALVIPTLGDRPDSLKKCIESCITAGDADIFIVTPKQEVVTKALQADYIAAHHIVFLQDLGGGLAAALDMSLRQIGNDYEFFAWINDDDLLVEGSLEATSKHLQKKPNLAAVYGNCEYIDQHDKTIGVSKAGKLARKILWWGPDLIPQPGSLFRTEKLISSGGIKSEFGLAFDYELFLRLDQEHGIESVDQVLAKFRWHSDSLTVSNRWASAVSAAKVRQELASGTLRRFAVAILNPVVMVATYLAGKLVQWRTRRL